MNNIFLTKREKEILDYIVLLKTTYEIAEILNITDKTVRNHISNIIQKLGCKDRTQAVIKLIKMKEIVIN